MYKMIIRSGLNFTHTHHNSLAVVLWYVHNCDQMKSLETQLELKAFSEVLDYETIKH